MRFWAAHTPDQEVADPTHRGSTLSLAIRVSQSSPAPYICIDVCNPYGRLRTFIHMYGVRIHKKGRLLVLPWKRYQSRPPKFLVYL